MDKERFCDDYCPIPWRFCDTEDPNDNVADCDLEENECPFNKVDFTRVLEANERIKTGVKPMELTINIVIRENPYHHFYAYIGRPDDQLHGNGDDPYEAITTLLESMREHGELDGREQ